MKLPNIIRKPNGFWYAEVPNTTNQEWLVAGKNGIELQTPKTLTFVASEKVSLINKLFSHFDSIKEVA